MDRLECVGVVSPGAMGSALGRTWRATGLRVVTTLVGRSARTAELARAAGLEDRADLDAVVATADLVVSVAPPGEAGAIAVAIAAAAGRTGTRPLVADLNAVAPSTVETLAAPLAAAGLGLVDGAISGGPPRPGTDTVLYLSGPIPDGWAERLAGPGLGTRVVGDRAGAASAVKMCTASVYKGFAGLLTQALLTAREHGVVPFVVDDLRREFPDQAGRLAPALALAASKAWRYVPEMREIAITQQAAGVRGELFEAMAQVWAMVERSELAALTPEQAGGLDDLGAVLDGLARPRGPRGTMDA